MASVSSLRRRVRSEGGAELVEFALVLPLLLFVVLGIVDFGFLFQRYEVVTNAAREGARIAVLPGYCTADVQLRVRNYLNDGGVTTTSSNPSIVVDTVPVTVASGPAINGIRVTVSYTNSYVFLGPIATWFGGSFTTVPLTGIAVMRPETPTAGGC